MMPAGRRDSGGPAKESQGSVSSAKPRFSRRLLLPWLDRRHAPGDRDSLKGGLRHMGEDAQRAPGAGETAVFLGPDGHIEDATSAALDLLGLSLKELRGVSPRALLAMADAESQALSETWRTPVPKVAAGEATVVRPDGTTRRVRFVLTTLGESRYKVVLEPLSLPADRGLVFYGMPDVLAAWRAAERRLAEAPPGSEEWETAAAESEAFRRQYQRLFESRGGRERGS